MTRRRLLLIHPPFYRLHDDSFSLGRYPIGLAYLAGTAKEETDWEVMVLNADFNAESQGGNYHMGFAFRAGAGHQSYLKSLSDLSLPVWEEVRQAIREHRPEVVGISAMTPNFASACNVASLAKEVDPDTVVVVGGPYPSIVDASTLDFDQVDVYVKGEGERTLIEILDRLDRGASLRNIPGTVLRHNGLPVESAARPYIQELGELCFPYASAPDVLRDYESYPVNAFNNVFANRGCPYKCAFCGSRYIWSRRVRFRPIDHLIAEIRQLQDRGVEVVYFCDDTFGVNKQWTEDLCAALREHCRGLKWSCEIHVNLISDEMLRMMKDAGCYKIELGIESGNNMILEKMGKQITIEKALRACRLIRKHGIELHAYFMAGFPDETESTLRDTLDAIRKVGGHVMISVFMPYPGTEVYDECLRRGIIDEQYDATLSTHQSLNHFCPSIPKHTFERAVHEIQEVVDRQNRAYRLRRALSANTLWRLRAFGLRGSAKMLARVLGLKH